MRAKSDYFEDSLRKAEKFNSAISWHCRKNAQSDAMESLSHRAVKGAEQLSSRPKKRLINHYYQKSVPGGANVRKAPVVPLVLE
jgi:hypothetical protein